MILVNGKEFEFGMFPNGETLMKHEQLEEGWKILRVSFKYEDDSDLIKLKFLKDYLDSVGRDVSELLIYYMPYSRMDRSEHGSPFTLKYVANFINSLKFKYIKVIEPHSDVTCALLDNVYPIYVNYGLIHEVAKEVGFNKEKDYLVFPDAGAQKRYSKILGYNNLVGFKNRDFKTGNITGLDIVGDTSKGGKKAIIVDDLTSYGTTFVQTSKALKEKGVEEVYLLVAHTERNAFRPHPATGDLLLEHINRLYTTDSIINEEELCVAGYTLDEVLRGLNQLKVYQLEDLV